MKNDQSNPERRHQWSWLVGLEAIDIGCQFITVRQTYQW